jgi:hypothetical protein
VAYQGTAHQEVAVTGSLETKQKQVFASYVQRMLTRRNSSTRYTPKQTIHWLSRLAGQMKQRNQTELYIERMQPYWLEDNRLYREYERLGVQFPGILIGILVGFLVFTAYHSSVDFTPVVIFGLAGGLMGGFFSRRSITQSPKGVTIFFQTRHTLSLLRCLLTHASHHLKRTRCRQDMPLHVLI